MRTYIASGWFTPIQEIRRLEILSAVAEARLDFYSPKDHGLYVPGESDFKEIFKKDIEEIKAADFIIASTEGKDMGTLFECGIAYAVGTPIIYYFVSDQPLNLMLAGSANYVAQSYEELLFALERLSINTVTFSGLQVEWDKKSEQQRLL